MVCHVLEHTQNMDLTAGETVTASIMNTHVRDNLLETFVAKTTAAGDICYASAANSLVRLPAGSARAILQYSAGSTGLAYGAIAPAGSTWLAGAARDNYHIESSVVACTSGSAVAFSFVRSYAAVPYIAGGLVGAGALSPVFETLTSTGGTMAIYTVNNVRGTGTAHYVAWGSDT